MTIQRILHYLLIGWFVFAFAACNKTKTTVPLPSATSETTVLTQISTFLPATSTKVPPTATLTLPTETHIPFPSLAFIKMVNEQIGWSLTLDDGFLLRTENGGSEWKEVLPEINIYDPGTVYILGTTIARVINNQKIYNTQNGGVNWESISTPFNQGSIQFINSTDGLVVADSDCGSGTCYFHLYTTHDGGRSWEILNVSNLGGSSDNLPPGTVQIHSGDRFQLSHASTIWLGGNDLTDSRFADLWVSRNWGQTWQIIQMTMPGLGQDQTSPVWVDLPVFMNDNDGYFAAKFLIPGKDASDLQPYMAVFITRDGGWTWFPRTILVPGIDAMSHIDFISVMDAIVLCGANLCVTNDGAQTWETIQSNLQFTQNDRSAIIAYDFVSTTTGWVILSNENGDNELFNTVDGGITWIELQPQLIK